MNFGINEYWKPTPKNIRKAADAIVSACTFAGGMTTLNGHPLVGTIIFVTGFVAKILSNFFSETPNETI
jgi:hypothetical protein